MAITAEKELDYPEAADSDIKKMEYLYSLKDKLKDLYNLFSKWASVGITKAEHGTIPDRLKASYPYTEKITSETFKKYLAEEAEEVETVIFADINAIKGRFLASTTYELTTKDV